MSDLVEFLLARLADDEAVARAATEGPWTWHAVDDLHEDSAGWVGNPGPTTKSGVFVASVSDTPDGLDDGGYIAHFDPPRMLADIAAKRRLLDLHSKAKGGRHKPWCRTCDGTNGYPCATLLALAQPFRDYPDFRAEWAASGDGLVLG